MSKTIDILNVIDTQSILRRYPVGSSDPNNPTGIADCIYTLLCPIAGSASASNVKLASHVGDTLVWRATSLTLNFGQAVGLYQLAYIGGDHVFQDARQILAKQEVPVTVDPKTGKSVSESRTDVYWQSVIVNKGTTQQRQCFWLQSTDSNNNPVRHYYYWITTYVVSA